MHTVQDPPSLPLRILCTQHTFRVPTVRLQGVSSSHPCCSIPLPWCIYAPVPVLLIWELHAPCWVNTGFPLYSQSFRVPCMLFQHLALAAVNMAPVLPFSVVGSEQCPAASGVLTTRRTSSYYAHVRILFISGVAPVLFTRGHAYYSPQCPHVIHRHAYYSQDLLHRPWRQSHCAPRNTPVIVVPDLLGVFLPGVSQLTLNMCFPCVYVRVLHGCVSTCPCTAYCMFSYSVPPGAT